MQTCFRCLLKTLLLSGLVALCGQLQASSFSQPKTLFYGLDINNFSTTLLQHGVGGKTEMFTHSTLDISELFGDPPNIANNDSPIIFATLLLSDSEIERLRAKDQEYVDRFGDQLQRELYISAAGFDAAKMQRLDEQVVPTDETTWKERIKKALETSHLEYLLNVRAEHIARLKDAGCFDVADMKVIQACISQWAQGQNSTPSAQMLEIILLKHGCLAKTSPEQTQSCADTLTSKLNNYQQHKRQVTIPTQSVVQSLENYGCFNEATKADFYVCSVRWVMETRAGIKFDRTNIIIEQDNKAQAAIANQLMRKEKRHDSRYFIVQATTYAQPYLNTSKGLLETPPWMDRNISREGGYLEGGTLIEEKLKDQKPDNITTREFMSSPETGVLYALASFYNRSLANNNVYIGGNKLLDAEDVFIRIFNPLTKRSLTKSQNGSLLLRIADPKTRGDFQSQNNLTDMQMQASLEQASKILSEVRDHGALSLAMFIALFEPSFPNGASLVIVGENAEWFANFENKPITDILRELSQDEDKFERAFEVYQALSKTSLTYDKFHAFDELNTHERDSKKDFLYPGMQKEYFREWLAQVPDRLNHVIFISNADYNLALLKALRTRYQLAQ